MYGVNTQHAGEQGYVGQGSMAEFSVICIDKWGFSYFWNRTWKLDTDISMVNPPVSLMSARGQTATVWCKENPFYSNKTGVGSTEIKTIAD